MNNFTNLAGSATPGPGVPAGEAAFEHVMSWCIWLASVLAVLSVSLWIIRSCWQRGSLAPYTLTERTPKSEKPAVVRSKSEKPAVVRSKSEKPAVVRSNPEPEAVQILRRSARTGAASTLLRLLNGDLDAGRRDRVNRVCEAIINAATSFEDIPPTLRAEVTDDGTTPAQDYGKILDLASNDIDAMVRDEANTVIDQIRALRRYAEQWAATSADLTVGARGQTGGSGSKKKSWARGTKEKG
ncbi:hypothetical protein ATK17_3898 [Branchiibius hedensis]|uniref:Uncharacterized protein n=1 Tax=Branchiibius hedensis TaxID=672460 RepID=A0A2Y9BMZ5_9MICO|nr:hypothetical protein [Branchiibius hedensis]PWJ23007.1 hypothetical protein ATK17_3898 [Branchiibius hedensis]SSA59083.1 hypothetical protein SAMN04489750_3898 [Branchiibius hedensis]